MGAAGPPISWTRRCPYRDGHENPKRGARVTGVTSDLLTKARAGEHDAFRALTDPHRRELHVHCYRMLGSLHDADDALQDTLLAAWQGLSGYEARASLRSWLYRIATHRCLNALRSASRRPAKRWDVPFVDPPEPTQLGEVTWLEPFPDTLLEGAFPIPPGPEGRVEQSEAISLAFVTALQLLPPRQLAVLVLRDVLGFHGSEVAEMLDSTLESVNSALKRARATLRQRLPASAESAAGPASDTPAERALVTKFASAYSSGDLDLLTELLTEDVFVSMPPLPHEYMGRDIVVRLFDSVFRSGRRFQLIPTRANNQPAFGAYLDSSNGEAVSLIVLTLAGGRIRALTRFDHSSFQRFGLPDRVSTRP